MARKFKVKKKFNLLDKIILAVLRLVLKRPEFINLNEVKEYPKRCILIGNHRSAKGPFTYRTFMEGVFMVGSAHQACENFRSRWNYLYHVFYRKKCNNPAPIAFIRATILGIPLRRLYDVCGALPIYFDHRLTRTFKYCLQVLEEDIPVAFFPENSDDGYFEIIKKFNGGFLTIAKLYYERHKEDVPIYTHHFGSNPDRIIIGKPMYYSELAKKHTDDEIVDMFREYMNSLSAVGKNEEAVGEQEAV
ncbi:MAG: hypothetical protein LBC99_06070 [Spirochaetota bacterium]|jgi:1-acyl-sn-glycerol-3-phosphate acyltransferase|nr:hypothetical protein [Spirochaetota bacterium]